MLYFRYGDDMKKIELHLHLDGSIDVEHVNELMGRNCKRELLGSGSDDLRSYLDKFNLPISLLQDYDNIEEFCYLLGKELEKDDVIYAEVRFCPLFHVEKISVDRVVMAVINGFRRVSTVKVNLIFCMMRHYSKEDNLEIIKLTKKYLGNGVCGIDLAGDEANYRTANFKELFDIVKRENIPFTIHAGEADNSTSVDTAISFGAKRIGHGVRCIENEATLKKIIEEGIVLEICPTSNVDTHLYKSIEESPLKRLDAMGVKVCINTDNRTVSNTNLRKEYALLREAFGFTDMDFKRFNLNAIDGAFLSDEEKDELSRQLLME